MEAIHTSKAEKQKVLKEEEANNNVKPNGSIEDKKTTATEKKEPA